MVESAPLGTRVYLVLLYDESTVAADDLRALRVRHEFVGATLRTLSRAYLFFPRFSFFDSLGFGFFCLLSG
jgi:hypothetical protein